VSRPFSPKAVVRAVPRDLLRAYCAAHDVPLDERVFDDDTTPSQAAALTRALSPATRPRFDGALRDVHDLATDDGTQALVAEAAHLGLRLPPEYHALAGGAARALWFLTHHREAFHNARRLFAADHLSARSSTAVGGLPRVPPAHATADLSPFRRALAEYFQVSQSRGRLCHIDALPRGHRLLLFVYLDDYPAIHVRFGADARLERGTHLPTFEVVFQFDHAAGTLSVFARGGRAVRVELLGLFCEHVLGAPCPSGVSLRPTFRLDGLLRPDATLPLDPTGGVTAARVRRLQVAVPRTHESVTLDAAPDGGREDIYRMLDRHFPADVFPRDDLLVLGATISVGYTAGGKSRTLTFDLTAKGSTTLTARPDEQQDLGQRLMRAWGITDAP
jgi:hypothetical protein